MEEMEINKDILKEKKNTGESLRTTTGLTWKWERQNGVVFFYIKSLGCLAGNKEFTGTVHG